MNRKTRTRLEMATRALEFSRAHPDDSDGYATAMNQLQEQLARAQQLADQQRQGIVESRAATARKRELQQGMRRQQLVHLVRVARRAAKDDPELLQKFQLPREPIPYLAFTTVARTMIAEGQRQKDLLIKHGLVERVLDSLSESLGQFDRAVDQSAEGRRMHIGAAANLDVVGDEALQTVKVIDGYNRFRFAKDANLLAAWRAASNVIGPPRTGGPSGTPAIKPAA